MLDPDWPGKPTVAPGKLHLGHGHLRLQRSCPVPDRDPCRRAPGEVLHEGKFLVEGAATDRSGEDPGKLREVRPHRGHDLQGVVVRPRARSGRFHPTPAIFRFVPRRAPLKGLPSRRRPLHAPPGGRGPRSRCGRFRRRERPGLTSVRRPPDPPASFLRRQRRRRSTCRPGRSRRSPRWWGRPRRRGEASRAAPSRRGRCRGRSGRPAGPRCGRRVRPPREAGETP